MKINKILFDYKKQEIEVFYTIPITAHQAVYKYGITGLEYKPEYLETSKRISKKVIQDLNIIDFDKLRDILT